MLLLWPSAARGAVPADAVDATIALSNKKKIAGKIYLTRRKPLRLFDPKQKEYRDFKLSEFSRITLNCTRKRLEREWYFKEEGNPEKVYTGRTYPRLDFTLTATFKKKERKLTFNIPKGQPIYIQPAKGKKKTFVLQPFLRGGIGQTPEQLVYVKEIVFARPDKQKKDAEEKTANDDRSKGSSGETDNRDKETTVNIEKQTASEKNGKQKTPEIRTGPQPEKQNRSDGGQKEESQKVTTQDEEQRK